MEKESAKKPFIPVIILLILIVICVWKISSAMYFDDRAHLIEASVAILCCAIGIIWMVVFIIKNRKKTV